MLSRRDQHPGRDPFDGIYVAALKGNIAPFLWPWEIAEWACVSTSGARSPWSVCEQLKLSRTEIWKRVNARLGVGVMCSGEVAYRAVNWLNNGHRSSKEAVAVFHKLAMCSFPFAIRLLTGGESLWAQYVLPEYDRTFSHTQSYEACWGGVANVMSGAALASLRTRNRDVVLFGRLSDVFDLTVEGMIRRRLALLQEFLFMTSNVDENHVWQCLLSASINKLSPSERAHIIPAQHCLI